jgi:hypothetical protein
MKRLTKITYSAIVGFVISFVIIYDCVFVHCRCWKGGENTEPNPRLIISFAAQPLPFLFIFALIYRIANLRRSVSPTSPLSHLIISKDVSLPCSDLLPTTLTRGFMEETHSEDNDPCIFLYNTLYFLIVFDIYTYFIISFLLLSVLSFSFFFKLLFFLNLRKS